METRLKHIFTQKVQSLTQSPAWRAPITPDGHLLSLCPSQSTWKKDHHLMDAITEPHILYLVSASDWNRKWLWRSILHPDEQKQRKLHSGKLRLARTEEQGCPQPRLTCLLVTWLQTAAPVVTLNALSSEQVSLSRSLSACSWQSEPFWEARLRSWVESMEEGKWEESQSDFKESCRKPCNRRSDWDGTYIYTLEASAFNQCLI